MVVVMVMVTVVIGDYLELGFYQFNALPLVTVADNTHVIVKKLSGNDVDVDDGDGGGDVDDVDDGGVDVDDND